MNRAARAALLVIAEDLQLDGEVDLANLYPRTDNTTGALRMLVTPAATKIGGVWAATDGVATTPMWMPVGHDLVFVDGARARLPRCRPSSDRHPRWRQPEIRAAEAAVAGGCCTDDDNGPCVKLNSRTERSDR